MTGLDRIRLRDGVDLVATVEQPADASSAGSVLFVHGFGGDRHENGLFDELAKQCVDRGLTTIRYNWRGIGGSGGDFCATSIDDHVADFSDVVKWVRQSLSSQPIYVLGFSLGASIVSLSLQGGESFDRVVFLSPAVRPRHCMWPRYDTAENRLAMEQFGRVEKEGSGVVIGRRMFDSLRDTDLGRSAFCLPSPLLVFHGMEDTRIKFNHTAYLYRVARANRARVQFYAVPGATHSFRPSETFWPLLGRRVVDWLCATVTEFSPVARRLRWKTSPEPWTVSP